MQVFVGLGNPGPKYARNRHNVGFMAADAIIEAFNLARRRSRFHSYIAEGEIAGEKVLVMLPKTFMNDSGRAVRSAVRFYKIKARDVTVFYDELDLALGKIRVKRGGGNAGHNGLRSMDSQIGKDYRRVRIGIGHPGDKSRVQRHVLGDFSKRDLDVIEPLVSAIPDALPFLIDGDEAGFMNKIALLCPPPKGAKGAAESKQGED